MAKDPWFLAFFYSPQLKKRCTVVCLAWHSGSSEQRSGMKKRKKVNVIQKHVYTGSVMAEAPEPCTRLRKAIRTMSGTCSVPCPGKDIAHGRLADQ